MRVWIGVALVYLVSAFVVFGPALRAPFFSMDDREVILSKPHLTHPTLAGLSKIVTPPTDDEFPEFYPVRDLSFALNSVVGGSSPSSFRVGNILLHVGVALLLAKLLLVLGVSGSLAFFVGGAFLVHPLTVEPVVWISGRKDLLMVLFSLLVLLETLRRGRWSWTLFWFALALFSKGAAVVLIAMAPLSIWVREGWEGLQQRHRVWLAMGGGAVIYLAAQLSLRFGNPTQQHLAEYGFVFRWTTAAKIVTETGSLFLWPTRTSTFLDLSHAARDPLWAQAAYVLVAGLVVGITAWSILRRRPFSFGLGLAVLGLLPYLNLLPNPILFAERYAYLPLVGLLIAVAAGIQRVRFSRSVVPAAIAVVLAWGGWTAVRGELWNSHVGYWGDVVEHFPTSIVGQLHLGNAHAVLRNWDEACPAYERAYALRPRNPWIRAAVTQNMGVCLARKQEWISAAALFQECLETNVCSKDGQEQARQASEQAAMHETGPYSIPPR